MSVYTGVSPFASPAGALDLVSFEEALKEHYKGDTVEDLVYKNRPLLALMPKYSKFGGRVMPIPVMNANPQNRSATFTSAQKTQASAPLAAKYQSAQIKSFLLQRSRDYSIARIDGETMDASKGDSNAFMAAATAEIDGAMSAISLSLAHALYRDGSGVICEVAANTANVISLTAGTQEDITGIEVGMALQDETGAKEALVIAVNRSDGEFTVTPISGTIATSDKLLVIGDKDLKVSGLESWVPATAPTAGDNHFGVDRSVDPSRLAGQRQAFDTDIKTSLVKGATLCGREGGRPDVAFMAFSDFAELELDLGAKVQYTDSSGVGGASPARIGFKALEIHAPYGTIKCIPDADCQPGVAWLLQMNTWSLNSLGECPRILSHDGNRLLRVTDADAIEARIGYYAQVGCKAPGYNCRVALA